MAKALALGARDSEFESRQPDHSRLFENLEAIMVFVFKRKHERKQLVFDTWHEYYVWLSRERARLMLYAFSIAVVFLIATLFVYSLFPEFFTEKLGYIAIVVFFLNFCFWHSASYTPSSEGRERSLYTQ